MPVGLSQSAEVAEFVQAFQQAEGSPHFYRTLRALLSWDQDPITAAETLRYSGAPAAALLFNNLRDRHLPWSPTDVEFIIGYVPERADLISQEERAKLSDWYACLAEAFDLVAFPSGLELSHDQASHFQIRFGALIEEAARIVVPLERRWSNLKKNRNLPRQQ
jgi:hypothetical protein